GEPDRTRIGAAGARIAEVLDERIEPDAKLVRRVGVGLGALRVRKQLRHRIADRIEAQLDARGGARRWAGGDVRIEPVHVLAAVAIAVIHTAARERCGTGSQRRDDEAHAVIARIAAGGARPFARDILTDGGDRALPGPAIHPRLTSSRLG